MTSPRRRAKPPIGWDLALIASEKARIKQELDAGSRPELPRERHELIQVRLAALADDDSDLGRLQRYIYAVSALVHHERAGGLSDRQVEQLIELAHALLQVQGIRPRASRMASLYGDIHLIKSQIDRKNGHPWRAAWEQQVALQLAGEFPSGGVGFQLLGMGNRALRLGHSALALQRFKEAEDAGLGDGPLHRCWLGRAHALWLRGEYEACDATVARALGSVDLGAEIRRELEWLVLTRQFQVSLDLGPMLTAVRSGGAFHAATYVIEACFWGLALESRGFLDRLPRLASMRRNKKLQPQLMGGWYEMGVHLQECYDHALPLPLRLRQLSQCFERREQLLTVDKELLLLAAATRWLGRSKSQDLALLVYSEYRALSHRLSDGMRADGLGLLADITARPWIGAA
jgi:hypothetical protein